MTIILSWLFILLYSSGFVATQYGIPYSDPFSFLSYRFLIAAAILTIICQVIRAPWPATAKEVVHQMIAGLLVIGVFSIGVFISLDQGISAGVSSLIISLQPLVASGFAFLLLKERIHSHQWAGLLLGVSGVTVIVLEQITLSDLEGILMSFIALLGLALGSLYQKRFCQQMNIFTGGVIQSGTAALLCTLIMLADDSGYVHWNGEFIAALFWMAVVVSIGALSILYLLIRALPISEVSSLFYLMPVSAVLLSALVFDQSISMFEGIGIMITALAVFLVNRASFKASEPDSASGKHPVNDSTKMSDDHQTV